MTKEEIEKELTELENRLKVLREKLQAVYLITEGFTPGRFWSVGNVLYILSRVDTNNFNLFGVHPGSNRYFDSCPLDELKNQINIRNLDQNYDCRFRPITKVEAIKLIELHYARFDE